MVGRNGSCLKIEGKYENLFTYLFIYVMDTELRITKNMTIFCMQLAWILTEEGYMKFFVLVMLDVSEFLNLFKEQFKLKNLII